MAVNTATTNIGSSILNSMTDGAGIDIDALATQLTEAETIPRQRSIESTVEVTEAKISAYGMIRSSLESLKESAASFNDLSEVSAVTISGNTSAFNVEQTGAAMPGSHQIAVTQLASPQRTVSAGYATASSALNDGEAFDLTLTFASGETSTVSADPPTPAGIVNAINASDSGVTASLINTGDAENPFRIALNGESGADSAFTMTSASADLVFAESGDVGYQAAQDAIVEVNGLTITRSTNRISDVIPGAVINATAESGAASNVTLDTDPSVLRTKLQDFVARYNAMHDTLTQLQSRDSSREDFSGDLAGDGIVRSVLNEIRSSVTGLSSTASGDILRFADIGIETTLSGALEFNEETFDGLSAEDMSSAAEMLSGGTESQSEFSTGPKGLAGDIMDAITSLTDRDGILTNRNANAVDYLDEQAAALEELGARMESVKARYIEQFGAMESAVSQLNSMRDYLKDQFEQMANAGKD